MTTIGTGILTGVFTHFVTKHFTFQLFEEILKFFEKNKSLTSTERKNEFEKKFPDSTNIYELLEKLLKNLHFSSDEQLKAQYIEWFGNDENKDYVFVNGQLPQIDKVSLRNEIVAKLQKSNELEDLILKIKNFAKLNNCTDWSDVTILNVDTKFSQKLESLKKAVITHLFKVHVAPKKMNIDDFFTKNMPTTNSKEKLKFFLKIIQDGDLNKFY